MILHGRSLQESSAAGVSARTASNAGGGAAASSNGALLAAVDSALATICDWCSQMLPRPMPPMPPMMPMQHMLMPPGMPSGPIPPPPMMQPPPPTTEAPPVPKSEPKKRSAVRETSWKMPEVPTTSAPGLSRCGATGRNSATGHYRRTGGARRAVRDAVRLELE